MKSLRAFAAAVAVPLVVLAGGCGGGGTSSSPSMSHSSGTMQMSHGSTSPAADLQVSLDQLLGEHALLAVAATQKGFDGSRDFTQVAGQLDQNSVALSKAIGGIYGAPAGKQFLDGKDMWRDHITDFVNYTVALKKHDTAGQKQAVTALNRYVDTFGGFLAKATGLPTGTVRADLAEHVAQLKTQIDAYAKGDYAKSAMYTTMAYQHMFMTGQVLADGIVSQSPSDFMQ